MGLFTRSNSAVATPPKGAKEAADKGAPASAAPVSSIPLPPRTSIVQPAPPSERQIYLQQLKVRIHQQLVERLDVQNLQVPAGLLNPTTGALTFLTRNFADYRNKGIEGEFAVAFAAGMVAVANPCGFAMLPAYLSFFLGLEGQDEDARASVSRAIAVSLAVSVGFAATFAVITAVVRNVTGDVLEWSPWISVVIGFALMLAGVLLVLTPGKAAPADATASTSGSARPAPQRKRSSFMDTINERWERRQDGDQGR